MVYYVYLIKTLNNFPKKTYVGYTNDLIQRLVKHNTNKGAKSTRGYKWKLIYKKKYKNKSLAMKEEYLLKKNFKLRKEIKENYIRNVGKK